MNLTKKVSIPVLALFAAFASAQTPVTLDALPVYQGAVLVSEMTEPAGNGLHFAIMREYTVKAPIEEVVAYYEKVLAVQKRFADQEDPYELAVGKLARPHLQVYFWDDSQFIDGDFGEGGFSKRAWIAKELQKRKKDRENGWIESATALWYYRDTKTTMTEMQISFQDMSIDEENKKYEIQTVISIRAVRYDYEAAN